MQLPVIFGWFYSVRLPAARRDHMVPGVDHNTNITNANNRSQCTSWLVGMQFGDHKREKEGGIPTCRTPTFMRPNHYH